MCFVVCIVGWFWQVAPSVLSKYRRISRLLQRRFAHFIPQRHGQMDTRTTSTQPSNTARSCWDAVWFTKWRQGADRDKPVSEEQARLLADDIGAETYIECSALTQKNLKEVFDEAILVALDSRSMLACGRGSKKDKKRSKLHKCSSNAKQFARSQDSAHQGGTAKKGLRKLCCFL